MFPHRNENKLLVCYALAQIGFTSLGRRIGTNSVVSKNATNITKKGFDYQTLFVFIFRMIYASISSFLTLGMTKPSSINVWAANSSSDVYNSIRILVIRF